VSSVARTEREVVDLARETKNEAGAVSLFVVFSGKKLQIANVSLRFACLLSC
jgi:hypothetical protein